MSRKRFLMIVEKPSIAVNISQAYNAIKDYVNYNVDIAVANNFVFDINDKYIVRDENRDEMSKHPVLKLRNRQVDECFRIVKDDDVNKAREKHIAKLVEKHQYDAIVNACDMDEAGDLIFAYTIESLGLDKYLSIRLNTKSLSSAYLESTLLKLKI